jgi:hypothetical protein
MGGETEPVRIRASGGPTRCPFCHADVAREQDDWVACEACLARHHAACWSEGKGCAGCGETRAMNRNASAPVAATATTQPVSSGDEVVPALDVSLTGRRVHFEGIGNLDLFCRDGFPSETFLVRVQNETDEPQRCGVRRLPDWLRVVGEREVIVAARATHAFEVAVDATNVPWRTPTKGEKNARGQQVATGLARGEFVLGSDDDSQNVTVDLAKEMPKALRIAFTALLSTVGLHVGVIFYLLMLFLVPMPTRRPGQSDASFAFELRRAQAFARARSTLGTGILAAFGVIALVAFLALATFAATAGYFATR